jgi:hypothetical protein
MVNPPAREGFSRTLGGVWAPASEPGARDPPSARFARTFVTYSELGGRSVDEDWIVSRLQRISAYDCLQALGRLSCMIDAAPLGDTKQQLGIMRRLGWSATVRSAAQAVLTEDDGRAMFFPQQVVHLARLAVLHADPRPMDGFAGGALIRDFTECVLGVTELLAEDEKELVSEEGIVSWMLRQTAINGRADSVLLWTRYYDIFVRAWRDVATPEAFDAAAAFERYTGISMSRWLIIGFALYTQFVGYGSFQSEDYLIFPNEFFSRTPIKPSEWEAIISHSGMTLAEARRRIQEEERKHGPTLYRCQTFEQWPLLQIPDPERFVPLAVDSFERRITEGMFWILSDGAIAEGRPREHFTSAFGRVFEDWVQRAFERALPAVGIQRVFRPKRYPLHRGLAESTDVVLDYEPSAVFVEVVSKRPQSATLTRGDYQAFKSDLEAGVLRKARQLDRDIRDFWRRRFELGTMDPARITRIFPVILSIEGFPSMPPIPGIIAQEISKRRLLRGLPPVALLGGEELAVIEAFMEQGVTFLEILSNWRLNPQMASLPCANFLDLSPPLKAKIDRRAHHTDQCWREFVDLIHRDLFGRGAQLEGR